MVFPTAVLTDAQQLDERSVRRKDRRTLATLSTVVLHHTGQVLRETDLDAGLRADLRWDSPTIRRILWDCAVELESSRRSELQWDRALPAFDTLRDVVDFLAADRAGHGASPGAFRAGERYASLWPVVGVDCDPATSAIEDGFPMPVEFCSGTPAEIGAQYGRSQGANIRKYIEHNVAMIGLEKLKVMPELQDAISDPSIYFTPAEVEEIQAMAAEADIPWDFVLGHNIGLYPDYVPGCSQFAVTASRNSEFGLVHGVNEDSPYSLLMREHLTRVMTVRRPKGGVPYVTFGLVGTVGGLNGVNAAGLIVSTTLLLDRPRRPETEHGVIQPILVRKILEAAATIPEAIEVIKSHTRNGAWSMCLSHFPTDRLCYVEYDGRSVMIQDHQPTLVSTNHARLHPTMIGPVPHSLSRNERIHSLLNLVPNRGVSPAWAKAILRDRYDLSRGRETAFPTMHTIRRIDNQGSFVIVPAAGELWATAGPMAPKMADRYFRVSLSRLFGANPTTSRM